jgi:dihydropteroate synthase
LRKKVHLQVNGQDHLLGRRTWIMGILNVTPDSFSDGNLFYSRESAIAQGLRLSAEGADIIDIGGESSRPGSDPIPAGEELRRVIPIVSELREKTETLLSIDTTKAEVAQKALEAGADIINDISAFRSDPEMLPLACEKNVPAIFMHMRGVPKSMQDNPVYDNFWEEIKAFFSERIATALDSGMEREKIILDPGIGFGKNFENNLSLIRDLKLLDIFDRPILAGLSRKSFIGRILNDPPQDRIEGSLAGAVLSVNNGAHILRVHDVAATRKAVLVTEAILNGNGYQDSMNYGQEKKQPHVC